MADILSRPQCVIYGTISFVRIVRHGMPVRYQIHYLTLIDYISIRSKECTGKGSSRIVSIKCLHIKESTRHCCKHNFFIRIRRKDTTLLAVHKVTQKQCSPTSHSFFRGLFYFIDQKKPFKADENI